MNARLLSALVSLLLACAGLALSVPARGAGHEEGDEPRARAAAILAQAERDDEALAFASALAGYEEAVRLDPSMPRAAYAEERARAIRARSEGGLEPLATLERVRRDPALASDARAIDALVEAAGRFPPGVVRVEAWVLAAEAYARRLDRPDDAVPLWRRIASDPAAEPPVKNDALRALAAHHLARGEWAAAAAVAADPGAAPELSGHVTRVLRRRHLRAASVAVLATALVLAAVAIVRAARAGRLRLVVGRARSTALVVLGYAAYVTIGGALLAMGYDRGTARPFVAFGAVLVPVLLVARAWGAAGSPAPSARALRALLSAASAVSAAFLVLDRVAVAYLEELGL